MNRPVPHPSAARQGRVASFVERILGDVAAWAHRHAKLVLIATLVVVACSVLAARRLKVSADLAQLLPKSFPSVQAADELQARMGGVGFAVVVVQGESPQAVRAYAAALAPKLERLEVVRYVEWERPNEFFADRALYFLSVDDLKTVRDRLDARKRWEAGKRAWDLGLDEDDDGAGAKADKPPSVDMSDILEKYEKSRPGVKNVRGDDTLYASADGKALAMFVKPKQLAIDLSYAKKVVNEVQQAIAQTDTAGLQVELTGTYRKKVEQQELITGDLGIASTTALLLIVVFIAIYGRSLKAVVFVMTPLLVGLVLTFAFAALAFDVLNLLTSFLGAILLGLGVDHGIHLLNRHQTEAPEDEPGKLLHVRRTFASTGRAVATAALTTAVGFAGLSFSEFRAFREFGIIAAVGSAFILVSYLVVGPAVLATLRLRGQALGASAGRRSRWVDGILRRPRAVLAISTLVAIALAAGVPRVAFNYDFAALQGKDLRTAQLDRQVNDLLGRSQAPVAFVVDDDVEQRHVAETLRQRIAENHDTTVSFVLTLGDLVPEAQREKRPIIDEIAGIARKFDGKDLTPEQRRDVDRLLRATHAAPFTKKDLPTGVRGQLMGSDGKSSVVLAFPSVNQHDGREVLRLARELRGIEVDGKALHPAAESMILADVMNMVITESPPVLAWTSLAMLITLLLLLGRIGNSLLSLGVGALTVVFMIGALPLFGLKLNYLNVVVIPVLFGLAVDGAVHMTSRVSGGIALQDAVAETARAIFGSLVTTALGFGALMLSSHPGLFSIGALCVVGLAVNALLTLVVLPAALGLRAAKLPHAPA